MLLIKKGREPDSLTKYRKTPYATYEGCEKSDIRKSLLAEQGYLCAYCMQRIKDDKSMHIEHWFPESKLTEAEKLNYQNMLGVCSGHQDGLDGRYDTCDAKKGDKVMSLDPRRADHIQTIKYDTSTGEISSTDPNLNHDLNETLNLNCKARLLPQNRKAALSSAYRQLKSAKRTGTWTAADVAPIRRLYESGKNGVLPQYAGIVRWWLQRFNKQ